MQTNIAAGPDELAPRLHAMWANVADGWEAHADFVEARGARLSEAMLQTAAVGPGDRVLELACGPGSAGLAAAERVAPDGFVLLSDVVPAMTETARRRAAARRLANVRTAVRDLEAIAEPDESYDAVLCREGLMFAVDPGQAAREIARVLAPGGRVAVATWGPRERNPWLGLVLDAVSAQVGETVPPPGLPGPFSLSDPAGLATLLADAGLADVAVAEVAVPLSAGSFDEWWTRTCALAGPLSRRLAALPPDVADALRARAELASASYATPAGLHFPGVALLAGARRPAGDQPAVSAS